MWLIAFVNGLVALFVAALMGLIAVLFPVTRNLFALSAALIG